jgi:hypothetical protein
MKNFIKTNYSKRIKMMNKKGITSNYAWLLGLILGLLALAIVLWYLIGPSVPRMIGVFDVI